MRANGFLSYGRDEYARAWVLNYTHRWFSCGATTSPSTNGHLIGLFASDNAAKRVAGDSPTKPFHGLLIQLAFWWFKFYLYLYFDGDGRLG